MTSAAPRATWRRLLPSGTALVVLGWAVFVALTLGTSLLGRQVFASTDLLQQWAPWDPGTAYETQNTLNRDIVDSLHPSYAQITERLARGDVAGWTSLTGPGQSLASSPNMPTLVPTVWPYLALPLWLAPAVVKVLQLAVGALGMFLLLRRWGTGRPAALLSGMIYATSGFFVSWANFPQASVAAFIPLLLWSVERYAQVVTPRPDDPRGWRAAGVRLCSGGAPVALVVACLFFSGFPAVAAWALYAAGAYLAVRLLARPSWAALRRLLAAAVAVATGLALTAVQLLPFFVQLSRSSLDYREAGFTYELPVNSLITSVLPRVMADDRPPLTAAPQNAIEFNAHLGSAALLLVLLALVLPRLRTLPRGVHTYLVVATVVCVLLLWFQNPLVSWFGVLPVFDGNPVGRLRAVLFVLLAALAGLGLDAVLRGERPTRRVAVVLGGLLGVTVTAAGVFGYVRYGYLTGYSTAVVDTAVALGGVALVGAAVLLRRRGAVLPVAVAVVTVQCVLGTSFYWNTIDRAQFYPERTSLDFLAQNQGHERVTGTRETLRPSTPALYGVRMLDSHTFAPDPWAALLRGLTVDEFDYFTTPTIQQLPSGSAEQLAVPGLDRLAARYAVTGQAAQVLGEVVGSAALGAGQTAAHDDGTLRTPSSTQQTVLEPGATLTTTIEPTALRAVQLLLSSASADAPGGSRLGVVVTDAAGAPVVSGERFGTSLPEGWTSVPLVGEDLLDGAAPGPWTVSVTWDGPAPLPVAGVGDLPALRAVVPVADDGLRLVHASEGVVVYERTTALPRFRWASDARVVPEEEARVELVTQGALPADTVVLGAPGAPTDGLPGTVAVTEDSGDTLGVEVDAEGAGYLVVADWMVPQDWTVTVDGQPAELVVADQALSAVAVPAGEHRVLVQYDPAGQRLGAALSTAAALVVLAALATAGTARIRQRRAGAPAHAEESS